MLVDLTYRLADCLSLLYSETTMKVKQIWIAGLLILLATGLFILSPSAMALECSVLPDSICENAGKESSIEGSSIWSILLLTLNILTAGVGVVAVGAIIFAGFLYATAQDNAQQTKKALEMIRNTAIGLLLFAGMFALVNFFVPGGVFRSSTTSTSSSALAQGVARYTRL